MPEKEQFTIEFLMNTSLKVLFTRLSTASGLSEWFADNVIISDSIYSFEWDGNIQDAKLIALKNNEYIKFQWLEDEGTNFYFEFRLVIDSLTGDLALVISDFADKCDVNSSIHLWESQISELKRLIGA